MIKTMTSIETVNIELYFVIIFSPHRYIHTDKYCQFCVSIKYYVNYLSITLRFCIPIGNSCVGLAVSYRIYVDVNNCISKLQLFRTCIYMMNKLIIIIIITLSLWFEVILEGGDRWVG